MPSPAPPAVSAVVPPRAVAARPGHTGLTRPVRAPATPFPQRDAHVRGVRLRYVAVGPTERELAPPLLLVHGLSSRLEEYDALVPVLARSRRVLVPDLPGSGYSDKPDDACTLVAMEDALLGFLDAVAVRDADVGGGSLGGNLALRLARREPGRVRRVVAWAPAGAWRKRPWVRALASLPWSHLAFWPLIRHVSSKWYAAGFPGREKVLRDAFLYYQEVYERGFARHYVRLAAEQLGESLFDVAPHVAQPTWLGVGEHDHALGMHAGVHALARQLRRARLRVFPGGHGLAAEVPGPLAEACAAFLDAPAEAAP